MFTYQEILPLDHSPKSEPVSCIKTNKSNKLLHCSSWGVKDSAKFDSSLQSGDKYHILQSELMVNAPVHVLANIL